MTSPDLIAALRPVVTALEELGVAYMIGGSVASAVHGVARTTIDIDLVADLPLEAAGRLAEALAGDCYVDEGAVVDAVRRRSSFNVIHLDTMLKVDVFVLPERDYERQALARRSEDVLDDGVRPFPLATAEDTVLHKLHRYRLGDEASDRQWKDAAGALHLTLTGRGRSPSGPRSSRRAPRGPRPSPGRGSGSPRPGLDGVPRPFLRAP